MIDQFKSFYKRIEFYLANTSWIMAEKISVIVLSFFVTAVIARYLGPEKYGVLAYSISLVSLCAVAGHVGLSGLVVRELVKKPEDVDIIMGTSFVLKGVGYLIACSLIVTIATFTEDYGSNEFWILIIVALGLIIKPLDVIDFWFKSIPNSKYTAISRFFGAITSSAFKLALVFFGAQLLLFAFAHIFQAFISALCLVAFFTAKSKINFNRWKFSKNTAKELFRQGWVIFLGSIFAVIYLKADQIMLKWIAGAQEVGEYSVAVTLSEGWYFIPVAIVTSFYPKLIKLKQTNPSRFDKKLQQLLDLLLIIALIVAIIVSLMAEDIILMVFGSDYVVSSTILVIHIWAGLFIFMRAAFSKWILIEDMLIFSLITQGAGAVVNIVLNLWLIPLYGGIGAAYATLIAYSFSSYFSLIFHSKSRVVFLMMTKSLFSPIRYTLLRGN